MELMVEQASLFLFRDGTVISMFSNEGEGVAENILERLKVGGVELWLGTILGTLGWSIG